MSSGVKMPAFALHLDSCTRVFDHLRLRRHTFDFVLVAIGSVITDLEEFHVLEKVHWRAKSFLNYLLKRDPKYAPLAIGMILHEELDKHIDNEFVNPRLNEAGRLLKKYNIRNIDDEAHYLIDHAVNCNALEREPKIIELAEKAMKRLSAKHVSKIAHHLASFFGGDKEEVIKTMFTFRDFDLRQYLSPDKAADIYGRFMFMKQELKKRPVSLLEKFKLGLKYTSFLLDNRKQIIKEICLNAKKRFSNHERAYLKACKVIAKKIERISDAHGMLK